MCICIQKKKDDGDPRSRHQIVTPVLVLHNTNHVPWPYCGIKTGGHFKSQTARIAESSWCEGVW